MRHALVSLTLAVFLVAPARATTLFPSEEPDPLGGGTCNGMSIGSYGTYIYNWPSKYDQVFWPHTDLQWIWFCEESGYVSFGGDFHEMSADERKRIGAFLDEHYVAAEGDMPDAQKLWLLEEIYRLRDRNVVWWSWFYRVKAQLYESLAHQSRRKAMPALELAIKELEGFKLIQAYYVLGDYHRRGLQEEKALELWEKAASVKWTDDEGNKQVGSDYINELIEERKKLIEEKP